MHILLVILESWRKIRIVYSGERKSISRVLFLLVTQGGNDHSSRRFVAETLKRPNPEGKSGATPAPKGPLLFGLAPGGVYPTVPISEDAGELLPHLFTLTPQTEEGYRDRAFLFSIANLRLYLASGLFSVALSPSHDEPPLTATLLQGVRTFLALQDSRARSFNLLSPNSGAG